MGGIPNKSIQVSPFLQEIIDGSLLSDACIISPKNTPNTARFQIRQCDRNKDWVFALKNIFDNSNISTTYKKEKIKNDFGNFKHHMFRTLAYVEFKDMYNRWYPNGKKIVPKDLVLSPIVLVNWYMGDGHLEIIKKKTCNHYRITFCTESFSKDDNLFLVEQLNKIYGYDSHIKKYRKNFRIVLSRMRDVKDFLFRTFPFHCGCFDYKWDALFDDSYMCETGVVKFCEVCGKEFRANRFHPGQKYCQNVDCMRFKGMINMRRLRAKVKLS